MIAQIYPTEKQLTHEEQGLCNAQIKDYDDFSVKQKIMTWWNTHHPTNTVHINPNIYGIDLVGIDHPEFAIEIERSLSWTSHHRPPQFKTVRIPIRKTHYWLPTDSTALFLQTNHDVTACVILTPEIIRTKYYNRILKTKLGYKEHFLEYYTWYYHELS